MSILVLHGLDSNSKTSQTCNYFKDNFDEVIAIDYPSRESKEEIIKYLRGLNINWSQVDAVVGCSLGGYWARYLGRELVVNTVLINPALNYYNDDDEDPKELPVMVIVCADDKVINPQYTIDKYKDRGTGVIILKDGGHRCDTINSCYSDIKRMFNTIVWMSD